MSVVMDIVHGVFIGDESMGLEVTLSFMIDWCTMDIVHVRRS